MLEWNEIFSHMKPSLESEQKPSEALPKAAIVQSEKNEVHLHPNLLPRSLEMQKNMKADYERAFREMGIKCGLDCADPRIEINMSNKPVTYKSGYDPDTDSSFEIEASINSKNGAFIAVLPRSVFYDKKSGEWKVVRHGIQVHDSLHGKGIGSSLTRSEEVFFQKEGIAEIYLEAGFTVGIYFNAREGFDFATPEIKSEANAKLISFILAKGITDVRLEGSSENLWPFKKSFSAHEMTKMRAYDHGKPIMVAADRYKQEITPAEAESITSYFIFRRCSTPPSEEVKKFLQQETFCHFSLGQMLSGKSREEQHKGVKAYITSSLENSNIQARFLRELGESGRQEYNRLISDPRFQEGFISGLDELAEGKAIDTDGNTLSVFRQENFPFGKAFFLDQGLKANFPKGWAGKKSLKKQKLSSFMDMPDVKEIAAQYGDLANFLEEVFVKDQDDPSHLNNASACYEMLMNRQADFIGTPLEADFWNAVSFEAFHMAQSEALKNNIENTLGKLNIAYDASKRGFSRSWEAYVKGTKYYFENDAEGLKEQIPHAVENSNVLKSLLHGLQSRKTINYSEDYGNMLNF
jgi:hypothetical protein